MKVAIIQSDLVWENAPANRKHFEEKIYSISEEVDVIVLPEMFSTGFTMNPSVIAETMQGETITWMQWMAKQKNVAITGSLVVQENNSYYNRMVFVFPTGEIQSYDKRHLFTLAKEDKIYTPGNQKIIISYKDWKLCLQICYDLRFPVFARNVENYDVLLYVASWPKPRILAWDSLLKARAIENMCYVIGVNRIGMDGNQHEYVGHSQIIDYLGNDVITPYSSEETKIAVLSKEEMEATRQKLNFLNDKDGFTLLDFN